MPVMLKAELGPPRMDMNFTAREKGEKCLYRLTVMPCALRLAAPREAARLVVKGDR